VSTGQQQVPGGQGLDLAVGRGGVADIPGFVSIRPAHDQVDKPSFPKPPSPRNCQGQVRVLRVLLDMSIATPIVNTAMVVLSRPPATGS